MNIKTALETEIQYLDGEIRKSYEFAEKRGDIYIGRVYRLNAKEMIESYKRIINSLSE